MRSGFRYVRPGSLDEALRFLEENGARTAVLAGGTDLSVTIRKGELGKEYVLDVSRLPEMRRTELVDGKLILGAARTFTELISDPLVANHAPVLAAACRCVGSLQIRNVGTLGGNVANASPAADSVPAMLVHNACVRIASAKSRRELPLERVITGPNTTDIRPDEIITGFVLEAIDPSYRFSFQRIARRRALAIARANAAAMGLMHDGRVVDVRLSAGSIMPRPGRLTEAEDFLRGKVPSRPIVSQAAELVSREMIGISGVRPSTEYKKPAVEGLMVKALADVFQLPV